MSIGEELPDADCELILRESPNDAFGLLAFDAWIGNNDRNERNLTYDSIKKQVLAFDHEQAICNQTGWSHLSHQRDNLSCLDGHALGIHVTKLDRLLPWLERIQRIPPVVVLQAVKNASFWLPSGFEYSKIAEELVIRQKMLAWLFYRHQNDKLIFPAIEPALALLPSICTSDSTVFEVEVPCDNDYRI